MSDKMCAITVSIDYGDFLATTLEQNRQLFDDYYVVTSPEDFETKTVAKRFNATVIETTRHKEGGADFNKGKAINCGIGAALNDHKETWLAHMDADIILPQRLIMATWPEWIGMAPKHIIYGIQRRMCESYKDYQTMIGLGSVEDPWSMFKPEGDRNHTHPPVGFFQLWHSSKNYRYPENHDHCSSSDLEFSKQWGTKGWCHLREYALHLSTVKQERWTNWRGRTSPRWGEA